MTFSIESFVFISAVFLIFCFIRRGARAYCLLAASIAFIAYLDINSCYWVLATSGIVYVWGLIEGFLVKRNKPLARVFMAAGVIICASSLFLLKQVAKWNFTDEIFKSLIMPLGFSYYIFQAVSY
ncbi:MAG: hypothetical protein K6C95_09135, partial [Lachnospiraceae bacterium]|nr:hypothetical protein [Lachnospiraceae bacterium]